MYPVVRVIREMRRAGRLPPLAPGETHVTRTRCWPQDLDTAWELNNGRSLTLFDMSRMALFDASGIRSPGELFADRPEPGWRAPLPEPVAAWAEAEMLRPWPPAPAPAARAAA